jgi:hypothetical protein
MLCFAHVGRFGRRIPLWVRCLALGLAVSWVPAISHWLLIETGVLPRFGNDPHTPVYADFGLPLAEDLHRRHMGYDPSYPEYVAVGYGWPVRNWGTVFTLHRAGRIAAPVMAVNLRSIWPEGDLPDPIYRMDEQQVAEQCATGVCPPTDGTDAYQRYLPVFPLILQSMIASVIYGVPFYIVFRWRDARRRRGSCVGCGSDLDSPADATMCPECGKARSIRPATDE